MPQKERDSLKRHALLLCLMLLLALAACRGEQAPVSVEGAWVRSVPASSENSAFYMRIENRTEETVVLDAIKTGACQTVELHETIISENGVMSMRPLAQNALMIPASSAVELEPGGLHIMCKGVIDLPEAGESVSLTLQFRDADEVDVDAEIRDEPP